MTEAAPRLAMGASLWALLVVAASVLPWGTFVVELDNPAGTMLSAFGGADLAEAVPGLGSMSLTVEVSGWSGSTTLVEGLDLPNASVPLVALLLAGLAWLRVRGVWSAPRLLELGLGTVAAALLVILLLALVEAQDGTVHTGSWLSLVGIVGLSVAVRGAREPGVEV